MKKVFNNEINENNINQIVEYCNNQKSYCSPYQGMAKLSDTKGIFI